MDEIDEKLALYHNILELEDWLEIKHNPQILKEAWDTMNDYCCDLERIRHEIAYSELEDVNEQSSNEADEKRKQIEESYRELEALKESQIKEHQTMMELDSNSDFIQEVEDDMLFEKLPLFKKIQEREDFIGIEHKSNVLELSEDEMWKYYQELMDMPTNKEKLSQDGMVTIVERKGTLFDYSGDDLSLDPSMW
ncbi:MAG: hypothetical protein MR641_07610 [Bacteroidales bacterium]|nr:hypothetical protein [Bacteroidales bacterium]